MTDELPMSAEAGREVVDAEMRVEYTLTPNDLELLEKYGVLDIGNVIVIGPGESPARDVGGDKLFLRLTEGDIERLEAGVPVGYGTYEEMIEVGSQEVPVEKRIELMLVDP